MRPERPHRKRNVSWLKPYLAAAIAILLGIVEIGSPDRGNSAGPLSNAFEGTAPLELRFEANAGQAPSGCRFVARDTGYLILLGSDDVTLAGGDSAIRISFAGRNQEVALKPKRLLPATVNYLLGRDASQWRNGISTYGSVVYAGLYPGVDLSFEGGRRGLVMQFDVQPRASLSHVRLELSGGQKVHLDTGGDLIVNTAEGVFTLRQPVARQKQDIHSVRYAVSARDVAFDAVDRDTALRLEMSVAVEYTPHNGDRDCDRCASIAVDASGASYVAGGTISALLNKHDSDSYVAKFKPSGELVYVTYFGGSDDDVAYGIAVDTLGRAYITGRTVSRDLPTVRPLQSALKGNIDAFVAGLEPDGRGLTFSTYAGGSSEDRGASIAVDDAGDLHVTGWTRSPDFPVRGAIQPKHAGGEFDAFVMKLSPLRGTLTYSTFLGGSGADVGAGVAADPSGNSYVAGWTRSMNLPATNAFQFELGGGLCGPVPCSDAFVAKIDPSGSSLNYLTYVGGAGSEFATSIAVDREGSAYVTGSTNSRDFPIKNAYQAVYGGGARDAFVVKIDRSGATQVYSTYLGGSGDDWASGIALDLHNSGYIAGSTNSSDFPAIPFRGQRSWSRLCGYFPCAGAFISVLNASGKPTYADSITGKRGENAYSVAVGASGIAHVAGNALSSSESIFNALESVHAGNPYHNWLARVRTSTHD